MGLITGLADKTKGMISTVKDFGLPDISNILSQAQGISQSYASQGALRTDPSRGQGLVSNIRHGVGTSLGRDAIAGWLNPSSISTGDPNLFARAAGTAGAWLGAAGSEVPDLIRGIRAGTPNPWVQPWEDILANTMGLKETGYYTSPEIKATNLASAFSADTGFINTTLQSLSDDADTFKDTRLQRISPKRDVRLMAGRKQKAAKKEYGAGSPEHLASIEKTREAGRELKASRKRK